MKAFFKDPVYGTDRQQAACYLPRTEWKERSCFGVRTVFVDSYGPSVAIEHLYGCAPTWLDIFAGLYWGPDEVLSLGEQLEEWGRIAHSQRERAWRLQERHFGRWTEWLVREEPYAYSGYGLAGRITGRLILSPTGKVTEKTTLSLADWYVMQRGIPHPEWGEVVAKYAENPPRELHPFAGTWHAPGAEPWN